jgi:hypothetical protein
VLELVRLNAHGRDFRGHCSRDTQNMWCGEMAKISLFPRASTRPSQVRPRVERGVVRDVRDLSPTRSTVRAKRALAEAKQSLISRGPNIQTTDLGSR